MCDIVWCIVYIRGEIMKKIFAITILLAVITISGCSFTPSRSGPAIIIETKEPITATNISDATKEGRACSKNYFRVISMGDSSVDAAKQAGGIASVASVDNQIFSISFIYSEVCTIVKGN